MPLSPLIQTVLFNTFALTNNFVNEETHTLRNILS